MKPKTTAPTTLDEVLLLERVPFGDRHKLPPVSGIYFVLFGAGPAQRIAYVGKAACIERRWAGHHRLPEMHLLEKLGIPTGIAWFAADSEDLEELEHRLVGCLTPPLNDGPTLRRLKARSMPASRPAAPDAILAELQARHDHAMELLVSEEFWNECNETDRGDCLCVWPFPSGAEAMDIDEQFACSDNHDLAPYRVVIPPAFAANDSGWAAPKEGFQASWTERFEWTLAIARQLDAFLFSVVTSHTSGLRPDERRGLFERLGSAATLEGRLRADPELLARGSARKRR